MLSISLDTENNIGALVLCAANLTLMNVIWRKQGNHHVDDHAYKSVV